MERFSINTGWRFAKLPGVSYTAPSRGEVGNTESTPHMVSR